MSCEYEGKNPSRVEYNYNHINENVLKQQTFESLDGLHTISLLFKNRQTPEKVRLRVTEFLYFYLLPEVEDSQHRQRESGYSSAQVVVVGDERVMGPKTRSIRQKEGMLGKHLKGIGGIVRDIRRVYGEGSSV